ncbi:MAG: acyl-CoA thioesterase [Bacteroidales bacterium]|nr:acyl-CoA thioesterase [Bacteroidales bacterium]
MFEYKLAVRGYELDSYGHVNNAVYLNYLEQARWEIFRQLDLIDYIRKNGLLLVVTEMQIRYSREIRIFDELMIRTEMVKEAPYLVFYHKMFLQGSRVKVCSANVKTLLTDKDNIKYDIPEKFLTKPKKG